jgi:hypothetical protein
MTYQSKFQVLEIPMPAKAAQIGIRQSKENINKVEIRRTVNGAALVVQSPFPKKMKFVVEASGKAIQAEAAFDAVQLGAPVTVYSMYMLTTFIAPGQTSVTLSHAPVPGRNVLVEDNKGNRLAYTTAGQVVTIAAVNASVVTVRYYPVVHCVLESHSGSATEVEGSQTWSGTFQEI